MSITALTPFLSSRHFFALHFMSKTFSLFDFMTILCSSLVTNTVLANAMTNENSYYMLCRFSIWFIFIHWNTAMLTCVISFDSILDVIFKNHQRCDSSLRAVRIAILKTNWEWIFEIVMTQYSLLPRIGSRHFVENERFGGKCVTHFLERSVCWALVTINKQNTSWMIRISSKCCDLLYANEETISQSSHVLHLRRTLLAVLHMRMRLNLYDGRWQSDVCIRSFTRFMC